MKHSIGNVSTSYIIRLILNDLDTFITAGKREFNFCSESGLSFVEELLADWLEWFNDYPQGISPGELKEIKREIGELMGSMSIWSHHTEEREGFIKQFRDYFGGYIGFCKLVRDVYIEELKDDLLY
ncbi:MULTISPECIES: hypothetical protein [Bacillus]|uniref:PXO1-134 n=1 Tax=Bacillus anthracis TaxID=1392 RepID=Q9X391_BACAN|nr:MULTISPECIES: hypothetical protein [Bacillus]AAM26144.1 hypothetical protein BX_A0202 [Bacillus anthracis str. A2012]AJI08247.1 hypothetical protein AQ16_5736 [Bacillus cereus G9241]EJT17152.1 hypothetical protein B353_30743 [Bacillus anthracis str. UR-1]EXJ17449.1 hypothetical protein Y693_28875 [Bacillus anthracis str. 95014]HDR4493340.1 hypothetical protein [Bacillus cereus biovar anthracis]